MQVLQGVFLWLLVACNVSASHPLEVWHGRNPLPTAGDLLGVAYGNGRFVAVGSVGSMLVSTNGTDWELAPSRSNFMYTVTFGRDRFVGGGTDAVYVSTNGIEWATVPLPNDYAIFEAVRAIGFGRTTWDTNGSFHAISHESTLGSMTYRSIDAMNWVPTLENFFAASFSSRYTTIACGNNRFIAGGSEVATGSPPPPIGYFNGNMWTGTHGPRGLVAFGDGRFVIAEMFDTNGSPVTLRSQTGKYEGDFVGRDAGVGEPPIGIFHGGGKFVVVGGRYAATSSDGTNWTTTTLDIEPGLRAVTYGDGLYVAVGTGGLIATSPDGVDWTVRTAGARRSLNSVVPDGDGFVAVGARGTILRSPTGAEWEQTQIFTSNTLQAVIKADEKYVAVGERGTVLSGIQVSDLLPRASGTDRGLNGVTYGHGVWVTVGDDGTIVSSGDAENWTLRHSGLTNRLLNATFGAGRFVAVGEAGAILSSTNGAVWELRTSPTNRMIADVAYGNGMFLALTTYGPVLASPDGENWEIWSAVRPPYLKEPPRWFGQTYPRWMSIDYADGLFIASAESNDEYDGLYFTSVDGRTWASHSSTMPRTNLVNDIAYNNGRVVSVGNYGRIFESDPIVRMEVTPDREGTVLKVSGPKEGTYRVESATSLEGPWATVTAAATLPAQLQISGTSDRNFYRVVREK